MVIKMKKGLHPQLQYISYVTQSGRLMHTVMTRLHHVGKVYHLKARRQIAESIGQIAKFKRRYEQKTEGDEQYEEFREIYKKEHPNVKAVSAVGKAGGEKWKSMSHAEKAPYEAKAAKRKSDYEKQMSAYNKKQESNADDGEEESDRSKSEVNDEDEEESGEEEEGDDEDDE
ncbi:hypothetical protein HPP92_014797 [Vanilla planifolia]|uniref:HMG box domain-containing protein n=1 Tax=Vanilla planifolia TaxID=51239 RepID=A0A835QQ77_VANPL|nr:hypothetical protein HPP92_014797 [Vanilla planifolia]